MTHEEYEEKKNKAQELFNYIYSALGNDSNKLDELMELESELQTERELP